MDEMAGFLRCTGTLPRPSRQSTDFQSMLSGVSEVGEADSGAGGGGRRPSTLNPMVRAREGSWDEGCLHEMHLFGLVELLEYFPELAPGVDWAAEDDAALARSRGARWRLGRAEADAVFRRIDTGGDGGLDAMDLRLWSRMLPVGRPAGDLARLVLRHASALSGDGLLRAATAEDFAALTGAAPPRPGAGAGAEGVVLGCVNQPTPPSRSASAFQGHSTRARECIKQGGVERAAAAAEVIVAHVGWSVWVWVWGGGGGGGDRV